MRIEELAAIHTIPGYDLVHFSEVAFPVWRINLTLQMQREIPLAVVEEFILKLIDSGVANIEEISNVLGIKKELVRNSALSLLNNDILNFDKKTQNFSISDIGKEVLDQVRLIVPEERYFSFYIDAITGMYCSIEGHQLLPTSVIKNSGIKSIHPSKNVPFPAEETLVFNQLEELIKNMQEKGLAGAPKGRLLEILSMDKHFTMYSKLRVLIFHDFSTGQYQYMVFDRDYRANEFDGILLTADIEEQLGVLPLEKIEPVSLMPFSERITTSLLEEASRNLEELKKAESKLTENTELQGKKIETLKINEDVHKLKRNTRLLRVYEFRSTLNSTFETAVKSIVIAVPNLTLEIFDDDLIARIDKSLQKGVKVFLFYANTNVDRIYARTKEKNSVIEKLSSLKHKKHGKSFVFNQIDLKDDKLIICDNVFLVVGAHKWIESSNTNSQISQGIKVDNCLYTENKVMIKETLEEISLLANINLGEFGVVKETAPKQVNIFFSYTHKDEELRDELEKHLTILKRNKVIDTWHDRKIDAGSDLDSVVDDNIKAADIILLLVSVDFLASDYCYDIEMKIALERHKNKEATVIPVILRKCDWASSPLRGLLALPTDGKSVSSWADKDEAFLDIAKGIKTVVEKIKAK
nr:TIR domain-containing protein [Paenibacillus xylanexedens]